MSKSINMQPVKRGALVSIIFFLFILIVVWLYGVYRGGWQHRLITGPATFLHLPVAYVDGDWITYPSFAQDLELVAAIEATQPDTSLATLSYATRAQNIIDRHIQAVVINRLAHQYNVEYPLEYVMQLLDAGLLFPGVENLDNDTFLTSVGMDKQTYVRKIIYPMLLAQQIDVVIQNNQEVQQSVYDRAQTVMQELNDGALFEELARNNSDDQTSAIDGGDLGWFSRGQMVTEFEEAVFALEPGQVSELVSSPFGLHIIRLEEIRADEQGKQERHARHILFSWNDSEPLAEQLAQELTTLRFIQWKE